MAKSGVSMLKVIFSILFIFALPTFAASEGKSCFQIDTGEEFCDLIFKGNARQLLVAGSGDAEHVMKIVSPFGVKPVLDKDGRAIVSFAFVQYVTTTVGAYNEFIIMYAVQRKDQKIGPTTPFLYTLKNSLPQKDRKNPEFGFYMQKLVLGGEDKKAVHSAIEVGIKGYGFPKISGNVEYDFETPGVFQVSVQGHDGSINIKGRMQNSYFGTLNMMATPVIIHTLTSGFGHPHWARAVGFSWGGVPQSAKNLQLTIDGGDQIKALQFKPNFVLFAGRYRFDLEGVK